MLNSFSVLYTSKDSTFEGFIEFTILWKLFAYATPFIKNKGSDLLLLLYEPLTLTITLAVFPDPRT